MEEEEIGLGVGTGGLALAYQVCQRFGGLALLRKKRGSVLATF